MPGTCLRFYVQENRRHHGVLLYEWLLEHAKQSGIHGGSALRAVAGFGRHGVLHEDHFFELGGDLPVVVEFILSDEEAERLLAALKGEGLSLFYARSPAEFGVL
jgi:PII-like signaling protein